MKVILRTYGGFAPALQPKPCEVDDCELQPRDAKALEQLVDALPQGHAETAPRPDERHYEIAIESAQHASVVRCADSNMSDAHAALVEFVERHGRRR
jgi:hypothetical protein